jgi:hypothetical protein
LEPEARAGGADADYGRTDPDGGFRAAAGAVDVGMAGAAADGSGSASGPAGSIGLAQSSRAREIFPISLSSKFQ